MTSNLCYSDKRVLTPNDIRYVGAIRMPSGTDTSFAFGGMTGRMVNGQVHFFVYGSHTGSPSDVVYEIADPGAGYTPDYHTTPKATLVANWGDLYHGRRTSWDSSGNQIALQYVYPGALFWNDATQLLYWTYHDTYNVTLRPDWGLGASQLLDPTNGTTAAFGPWRTVATNGDGAKSYGTWRCNYLFASPFDGSMMCGSTIQAGNSGAPWGPDAFGGAAWPSTGTPSGFGVPDINLPNRYLEYYYMGNTQSSSYFDFNGAPHGPIRSFRRVNEQAIWEPGAMPTLRVNPALNGGVGTWTELDGTSGAVWLELANTRGVIFSATLAGALSQDPSDCVNSAHEWYNQGGTCTHGCRSPVAITGPVSTQLYPALILFDPNDLNSVKTGAKTDYTVDATAVVDLAARYNIQTAGMGAVGAARGVSGFYFDPIRKYLFVVAAQADDSAGPFFVQSLIHVFAINDN